MNIAHEKIEAVALALGSNLGDRVANLRACVAAISPYLTIHRKSAIYETPPAYVVDQPHFLNAAVIGISWLKPLDLLRVLQQAEKQLGRTISYQYGPRLIDIDMIFYGDRKLQMPELTLPHPRIAEREFVLRPMVDIAGEWIVPDTGKTVNEVLAALANPVAIRIDESL